MSSLPSFQFQQHSSGHGLHFIKNNIIIDAISEVAFFSQFNFICKKEKAKWLQKGAQRLTLLASVQSYCRMLQNLVLIINYLIKMPPKFIELVLFWKLQDALTGAYAWLKLHVPSIVSIFTFFSFVIENIPTRLLSLVELLATPSNVRFIRILKFLRARWMLGSDTNRVRASHLTQRLRFSCQSFHETYIWISTNIGLRAKFCVS